MLLLGLLYSPLALRTDRAVYTVSSQRSGGGTLNIELFMKLFSFAVICLLSEGNFKVRAAARSI